MPSASASELIGCALGAARAAVVAAAVRLELFQLAGVAGVSAAELAEARAIEPRVARALLDGLVATRLFERVEGRYRCLPEAAELLLPGRDGYLGDFVVAAARDMALWARFDEAVRSGEPLVGAEMARAGWHEAVAAFVPFARAAARTAAERFEIARAGAFRLLDLGGGAGGFAAEWLSLNPAARAVQIDWGDVNDVARARVDGLGVGERFETWNGDVREVDFAAGYRFVVMSQLAHFFSDEECVALFARARAALEPGGVLVIADFILDDERGGEPMALLFGANMLLATEHGRALVRGEVERWLGRAGFDEIGAEPIAGMPHSLIYAR